VLPIVLPAKSLTINDVADVADFPDPHINLVFLGFLIVILILISKLEILPVSCFQSSRRSSGSWFPRFPIICQFFLCSLCSLWQNDFSVYPVFRFLSS